MECDINAYLYAYDIVSDQLVWQIVQSHLSELVDICNQLLGRL